MGTETAADVHVSPGVTVGGVQDAPTTGVQVYKLVQNVVSGAFWVPQFWVPLVAGEFNADSVWISMMSESEWFIIWSTLDADPPDPLPTATPSANPTQQCIRVPANFEYMRLVPRGYKFKLLQIASVDDTYVRLEIVQPIRN